MSNYTIHGLQANSQSNVSIGDTHIQNILQESQIDVGALMQTLNTLVSGQAEIKDLISSRRTDTTESDCISYTSARFDELAENADSLCRILEKWNGNLSARAQQRIKFLVKKLVRYQGLLDEYRESFGVSSIVDPNNALTGATEIEEIQELEILNATARVVATGLENVMIALPPAHDLSCSTLHGKKSALLQRVPDTDTTPDSDMMSNRIATNDSPMGICLGAHEIDLILWSRSTSSRHDTPGIDTYNPWSREFFLEKNIDFSSLTADEHHSRSIRVRRIVDRCFAEAIRSGMHDNAWLSLKDMCEYLERCTPVRDKLYSQVRDTANSDRRVTYPYIESIYHIRVVQLVIDHARGQLTEREQEKDTDHEQLRSEQIAKLQVRTEWDLEKEQYETEQEWLKLSSQSVTWHVYHTQEKTAEVPTATTRKESEGIVMQYLQLQQRLHELDAKMLSRREPSELELLRNWPEATGSVETDASPAQQYRNRVLARIFLEREVWESMTLGPQIQKMQAYQQPL